MIRELQRSTSAAMKPAISRATSFSAATLRASISADALDGAQWIAQLVRQPGRKLSQRRQPVRPADCLLGLLDLLVGVGKLLGRELVFSRLGAQFFGQDVGEVANHQL